MLLSVVGLDNGQRVPHYSGKREQERLVGEITLVPTWRAFDASMAGGDT